MLLDTILLAGAAMRLAVAWFMTCLAQFGLVAIRRHSAPANGASTRAIPSAARRCALLTEVIWLVLFAHWLRREPSLDLTRVRRNDDCGCGGQQ